MSKWFANTCMTYSHNLAISVPFSHVACRRLRTVDKRERLWPREFVHVEWSGPSRPPELYTLAPRTAQQHCGRPGLSGHRVPQVRLRVGGRIVLREAFVHLRDELWPESTDSLQSKYWNHNRIGVLKSASRMPKFQWRNELLLVKENFIQLISYTFLWFKTLFMTFLLEAYDWYTRINSCDFYDENHSALIYK